MTMTKDARMESTVTCAMDGKNSIIIRNTIERKSAWKLDVKKGSAPTIIQKKREGYCRRILKTSVLL